MKWFNKKSRVVTKLLTFLGFSSATFVLTACYGTIPKYGGDEAEVDVESLQQIIDQDEVVEVGEVPQADDAEEPTVDIPNS